MTPVGPTVLQSHEGTKFPLARVLRERAIAVLSGVDYDTVVPYATFTQALGLDVATDKRGRDAVLQAGRHVLKGQHKKLVNVRHVGYRVVRPNEQAIVSQGEQRRSRRWLKRALDTVTFVALDKLTPPEVASVLTEQAHAALALSFQRKITKQVLPPKDQLAMPSGAKLVEILTKKQAVG